MGGVGWKGTPVISLPEPGERVVPFLALSMRSTTMWLQSSVVLGGGEGGGGGGRGGRGGEGGGGGMVFVSQLGLI